jgi:hypothetical protein
MAEIENLRQVSGIANQKCKFMQDFILKHAKSCMNTGIITQLFHNEYRFILSENLSGR